MSAKNQIQSQLNATTSIILQQDFFKLAPSDAAFVEKVKMTVLDNLEQNKFKAADLAKRLYLTESQLSRRLNFMINIPTGGFIRTVRINHAANLLLQKMSVEDVAFEVGYRSAANFCRSFKQIYGCSPSKFVKQKKLQKYRYGNWKKI